MDMEYMDCTSQELLPRGEMMRILSERRILVDDEVDDQKLREMINKLAPLGQRAPRNRVTLAQNIKRKLEEEQSMNLNAKKILLDEEMLYFKRRSEGEADYSFKRMRISD